MAHKNQEDQNISIEFTLRLRIRWCREKIWSIRKWVYPLLVSLLIKVAIHFFHHG